VRPTQPVENCGNVSTPFDTLVLGHRHLTVDIHGKFYGDRPRGTPPSARGGVKHKGSANRAILDLYYISETVQYMR